MRIWKALIFTAFDGTEQALVICWNNRRSYILKYTLLRNLQLIYDLSNLRLCILLAQYWESGLSGKRKEKIFFPSLLRIISNSILGWSPRWNKNIKTMTEQKCKTRTTVIQYHEDRIRKIQMVTSKWFLWLNDH